GARLPTSPELVITETGEAIAAIRTRVGEQSIDWNGNRIRVSTDPLAISVTDREGQACQDVRILADGTIDFALGNGPLFGLGQGGRQFDRRGATFEQINGQGEGAVSIDMNTPGARAPEYAFDLAGEGARITIPWIISTDGWACYFGRPQG